MTARELTRNMADMLDRVAAGEKVEVTRNGELVAVLSAPAPGEAAMFKLVRVGVFPEDWREQQKRLLGNLGRNPPRLPDRDQQIPSEILLRLRDEEDSDLS